MISQDRNWQTYRNLQETLSLNLRRQIFVAVCDDPQLCQTLVTQLDAELCCNHTPVGSTLPQWVTLELEVQDPNLVRQIDRWQIQMSDAHSHHSPQLEAPAPHPRRRKDDWSNVSPLDLAGDLPRQSSPGFQFVGVEHLTRQPPSQQWSFLQNLEYIAQRYLDLAWEWNLLLWVPRPWLLSIQQSVPRFWQCRTGLFEFAAEPLPAEFASANTSTNTSTNTTISLTPSTAIEAEVKGDKLEESQPENNHRAELEQDSLPSPPMQEQPATVRSGQRKLETVADIQAAITHHNLELDRLEPDAIARLDLYNDLGNLYWILARKLGRSPETFITVQQAITTYELALSHPAIGSTPQGFSRLQNNLGIAYGELACYGDPITALEKAIAAYQEALSYRQSQETNLEDLQHYASTQNNLGTAYWNLAQHQNPVACLKQAIAAYQEALKYYHPDRDVLSYGMIQNNLGTAYWNLSQHERPQDYLKLAIWSYQLVLQYRTLENNPTGYAATQNNLGMTYWHMANRENVSKEQKQDMLQNSIRAWEQAIAAISCLRENTTEPGRLALNFDPGTTHHHLAVALYQSAMTARQISPSADSILETLQLSLKQDIQAWEHWQDRPKMAAIALKSLLQTLRTVYNEGGIEAQNQALGEVPRTLLPEILHRL
ncbi:tetratricopeptide repeat protein [Roseofilum casamattae]|uniref:Tetratricopeptide repeat protein n=1 Tax=Roseofilum casamattae BLCC-M143 TaxID=3022442 RepID=A0ABT7BWX7_9CYAN|nr:tetratricopeptide repeat protein [Roseofilum casamattae]MDJ1183670.1 tetratricopeptide repeat protein [Roseofilum casamattae BLCC-M143]